MEIPFFKTIAGNKYPLTSIGKDEIQYSIHNCTIEEVVDYAKQLEDLGFIKYDQNVLPSLSSYNKNVFYTFVKEDTSLFVGWFAELHIVRIILAKKNVLPKTQRPSLTESDNTLITITQTDCVCMGYVVQLADQSFIIVDGGSYKKEDEEKLFSLLKSKTTKNKKPIIASWFFTHADQDHTELASHFIKNYEKEIELLSVAYNFPLREKVQILVKDDRSDQAFLRLEENVKNCYPNAVTYTLRTGQRYYFKGAEIEILWTPDDTVPATYVSYNDLNSVFRFKFTNQKTFMVLGDTSHLYAKHLALVYGDYLKSDIMQVSHHGLIGGDKLLYQFINPDVCLWPVKEGRFNGTQPNQRFQWCLGEGGCDYNKWLRDESVKKRKHYHCSKPITINVEE